MSHIFAGVVADLQILKFIWVNLNSLDQNVTYDVGIW